MCSLNDPIIQYTIENIYYKCHTFEWIGKSKNCEENVYNTSSKMYDIEMI